MRFSVLVKVSFPNIFLCRCEVLAEVPPKTLVALTLAILAPSVGCSLLPSLEPMHMAGREDTVPFRVEPVVGRDGRTIG